MSQQTSPCICQSITFDIMNIAEGDGVTARVMSVTANVEEIQPLEKNVM